MTTHLINLALALLFLALMAQLSIQTPEALGGIPITGQSLAVLLVGLLLPAPYGGIAVLLYVLLGALGLPVYAEGRSGWGVLSGGSGGFLIGFIPAAFLLGYLRQRGWGQHLGRSLLANLIGTVLIVSCGLLRLAMLYDWPRALDYGLYPFVEGAIVKIFIGGFIAWSLLRRPSPA
mgnify:CR=1 FL=1